MLRGVVGHVIDRAERHGEGWDEVDVVVGPEDRRQGCPHRKRRPSRLPLNTKGERADCTESAIESLQHVNFLLKLSKESQLLMRLPKVNDNVLGSFHCIFEHAMWYDIFYK